MSHALLVGETPDHDVQVVSDLDLETTVEETKSVSHNRSLGRETLG